MGKSLSEDLRWRIIYCQAEGLTQKEIAKRIYVGMLTVRSGPSGPWSGPRTDFRPDHIGPDR